MNKQGLQKYLNAVHIFDLKTKIHVQMKEVELPGKKSGYFYDRTFSKSFLLLYDNQLKTTLKLQMNCNQISPAKTDIHCTGDIIS